ncbi:hypothetical protein ADL21_15025 [Streptomyces albus subsp. albus]|nr:hypothetical protein ADL21_15025 [Streptomyces albus subsp. albus]
MQALLQFFRCSVVGQTEHDVIELPEHGLPEEGWLPVDQGYRHARAEEGLTSFRFARQDRDAGREEVADEEGVPVWDAFDLVELSPLVLDGSQSGVPSFPTRRTGAPVSSRQAAGPCDLPFGQVRVGG